MFGGFTNILVILCLQDCDRCLFFVGSSQRWERQEGGGQQGQKGPIGIQEEEPQGRGQDKEQGQAKEGKEAHTLEHLSGITPPCLGPPASLQISALLSSTDPPTSETVCFW